ncbi:MAG: hypothetical protein ACYDC2_05680 [Solirubrobacteraceae bacterium]
MPGTPRVRARASALVSTAAALVSIASALALGGCGGSSPHGGSASVGAPRALGRRALLVRADLPAGWHAEPDAGAGQAGIEGEVASCIGVPAAVSSRPQEVQAPVFTRAATQVTNSVAVMSAAAQAEAAFALFNRPESGHCLGVVLARRRNGDGAAPASGSAARVAPGRVRVRRLTVASEADASIGYRILLPPAVYGHTSGLTFDLVVLRVGQGLSYLLYGGRKVPEAATERRLNIVVSERLRAAVTGH